jgi:hypothetical protein
MFDNLAVVHLDHLEKGIWRIWKGDRLAKEYRALRKRRAARRQGHSVRDASDKTGVSSMPCTL